jgi:orotidine-5'-phosphate decarboxylase
MTEKHQKVIVALDYENPDQAFKLVEELGNWVQWYKVGTILFTRSGTETIRYLHERGKKIFVDLKLHDTPYVVGHTVTQLAEMGVDMTTLHISGGRAMLEAANLSCRGSSMKLIGISLLTSLSQKDGELLGWAGRDSEIMNHMIDLAHNLRLGGIICSPHELKSVRERTLPGFTKITAGIRPKGREVFQDDQQRVATPSEALDLGADYLVVGRPVTHAREPLEVVKQLFE